MGLSGLSLPMPSRHALQVSSSAIDQSKDDYKMPRWSEVMVEMTCELADVSGPLLKRGIIESMSQGPNQHHNDGPMGPPPPTNFRTLLSLECFGSSSGGVVLDA